jgi:carbamoyltransferase
MVTLGIVLSHDGTLSIVRDGRYEYSCGEERLNRIKAYIGFPFLALREAVASGRLVPEEVEVVAIPLARYPHKAARTFAFITTEDKVYYDLQNDKIPQSFFLPDDGWRSIKSDDDCRQYVERKVRLLLNSVGINAPIEFYDHHLAHAASAYYPSGFSRALAITMDGEGDGLSATVSICEANRINRIHSVDRLDSAGYLYAAVTKRCGFKMSRHEGKITGLAAYGDPDIGYERLSRHVKVVNGGLRFVGLRNNGVLEKLLRRIFRLFGIERTFGAFHLIDKFPDLSDRDLSATVQIFLQDRIAEIVSYWVSKTGIHDVVLAGGIFANVKFNQIIGELDCVDNLFIFPDMGDGGTAYGAAIYSDVRRRGHNPVHSRLQDVYLGPTFSDEEIRAELKKDPRIKFYRSDNVAVDTAKLIANGCIIGWFQGPMEYGPRALGHRSILASPVDASINKWLNDRMQRNEFMPFAPSCLYEFADELFEISKPNLKRAAEFMTITFRMKDEWAKRAPAVSHVDQTARPHLVRSDIEPLYHRLLSEYMHLTGLPLVINTSFNIHEEPIVCKPMEAIKALRNGVVDALSIGNFVATYHADLH